MDLVEIIDRLSSSASLSLSQHASRLSNLVVNIRRTAGRVGQLRALTERQTHPPGSPSELRAGARPLSPGYARANCPIRVLDRRCREAETLASQRLAEVSREAYIF